MVFVFHVHVQSRCRQSLSKTLDCLSGDKNDSTDDVDDDRNDTDNDSIDEVNSDDGRGWRTDPLRSNYGSTLNSCYNVALHQPSNNKVLYI